MGRSMDVGDSAIQNQSCRPPHRSSGDSLRRFREPMYAASSARLSDASSESANNMRFTITAILASCGTEALRRLAEHGVCRR